PKTGNAISVKAKNGIYNIYERDCNILESSGLEKIVLTQNEEDVVVKDEIESDVIKKIPNGTEEVKIKDEIRTETIKEPSVKYPTFIKKPTVREEPSIKQPTF